MTIGDNRPDDIACFPKTGKARMKATGKIVPIEEIEGQIEGNLRRIDP